MATNDSTGLDDNGTDVSQQLQLEAMKQAIAATKSSAVKPIITTTNEDGDNDSDNPPSPISSENLLRRPSFKRILDDLSSSAETTLGKNDGFTSATAATIQAQQAVLQQAAGLTNPALLPLLQGLQQQSNISPATSSDAVHLAAAAMMLPNAQQLQLQSALLNTTAHSLASNQSPLVAGAASLAGQNNLHLPANLLSSALLNAASNNALSNQLAQLTGNSPIHVPVGGKTSLDNTPVSGEDSGRKREVRLMKNREAARECRRKKKEYIRCLENRVAVLESQNQALIGELRALKELYLPKNQD